MNQHYDVVIVGGGPAGSTAALYLSKFGLKTCLIEKKKFPREVLCGEFLSVEVTRILKELNLFESFLLENPVKISKFKFTNEQGSEISSKLNFPAYALKRSIFDHFLLRSAAAIGVKIFQPAEVKTINREGDNFFAELKLPGEQNLTINSDYVIVAYGKQNILDKKFNRSFAGSKTKFQAIKFHIPNSNLENFPEDEIRVYIGDGIYCGLNKVSELETTLCIIEKKNNGDYSTQDRIFDFIKSNSDLRNLFVNDFEKLLKDLNLYGSGNIYFGKKSVIEKGIFMVGDAAGVIAPFSGDGIGMAVQSAQLISKLISEHKNGSYDRKELEGKYSSEWNKLFLKRIRIALIMQKIIFAKKLKNISFFIIKNIPFILQKLLRVTRGY